MLERRIYKAHPCVDGGLCGHVPARPGCTTPQIRFLYVAPHLCIGLPPDSASQRNPCPSPNLRLHEYLVQGLAPCQLRAMPGTHGRDNRAQKQPMATRKYGFRPHIPSWKSWTAFASGSLRCYSQNLSLDIDQPSNSVFYADVLLQ